MSNSTLPTTDQRMLELMKYAISSGLIKTQKDFCASVGISHHNLPAVKSGRQGFTVEQIANAINVYKVTADYLFGITDKMFSESKKQSPLDRIKEALHELEHAKK